MLRAGVFISGDFPDDFRFLSGNRVWRAGLGLWLVYQPSSIGGQCRVCPDAGDFGCGASRRPSLPQPTISRDCSRWRRRADRARTHSWGASRDWVSDRGGVVGSGRLHRDERFGAGQCEDGASGAQRAEGRARDRIQGRSRDRAPGGRPRPARGRHLLLHPARDDIRRRPPPGARSDGWAELRRVADLDLRPPRRRHFHQRSRCRSRPRRQS